MQKKATVVLLAGAAFTGCSYLDTKPESKTFEVGVVCANPDDEIDITKVDNKNDRISETKEISLKCGVDAAPQSLELISGGDVTITDETNFSDVVQMNTRGPEGYQPSVSFYANPDKNETSIEIDNTWTVTAVEVTDQPGSNGN